MFCVFVNALFEQNVTETNSCVYLNVTGEKISMYAQFTKRSETNNEQGLRVGLDLTLHGHSHTRPAPQASSHSACTTAEIHFAIKQCHPACTVAEIHFAIKQCHPACTKAEIHFATEQKADPLSLHYGRNPFCHNAVTQLALQQKFILPYHKWQSYSAYTTAEIHFAIKQMSRSLSLHYSRNSFCHKADVTVTQPALQQKSILP